MARKLTLAAVVARAVGAPRDRRDPPVDPGVAAAGGVVFVALAVYFGRARPGRRGGGRGAHPSPSLRRDQKASGSTGAPDGSVKRSLIL